MEDALACKRHHESRARWADTKEEYDEAKEDDELQRAAELRKQMEALGWQAPRVVKGWAKPSKCTDGTLRELRASVKGDGSADRAAEARPEQNPRPALCRAHS